MKETFRDLFRWFIPHYDEVVLWCMGLSVLLAAASNHRIVAEVYLQSLDKNPLSVISLSIFVVLAIYFSMVHALITARKSALEKVLMLQFALWYTIFVGLAAGAIGYRNAEGWWVVFPVWNLVNAVILLLLNRFKLFDEREVSDRDASGAEILVASLILLATFALSHYVFAHDWSITLSLCLIFSCNLVGLVLWLFDLAATRWVNS